MEVGRLLSSLAVASGIFPFRERTPAAALSCLLDIRCVSDYHPDTRIPKVSGIHISVRPAREALPDVLAPGLKLVICGTAAGERSASAGAYYAHPSNRFWKVLSDVGLTPNVLDPASFRQLLTFGIGLTDLAKHYRGTDASLKEHDSDIEGFRRKIYKCSPRILAFNGKRAASEYFSIPTRRVNYGRQKDQIGSTALFVVTQTSGSNGHWKPEPWYELACLVREVQHSQSQAH